MATEPATPGYEITRFEIDQLFRALGFDPREVVRLNVVAARAVATLTTGAVVSVRITETRK
jgi:hypothetical protein